MSLGHRLDQGAIVIAIASGKGGVGKTNVVVNLAVGLARLDRRVAVIDGDFSLGNVDVALGLTPAGHIGHVLKGEKTLNDVIVEGPSGIRIVPAGSGLQDLASLNPIQRGRFELALNQLRRDADFVLIDTATGISDNVIETVLLADWTMIVTSTDPSAVVDAYATAKVLNQSASGRDLGLVINAVHDAGEAAQTFRQIDAAARRFLQQALRYYGFIPQDPTVRLAASLQRPVLDVDPQAPASRSYRMLASRIAGLGPADGRGLRLAARNEIREMSSEVSQCA